MNNVKVKQIKMVSGQSTTVPALEGKKHSIVCHSGVAWITFKDDPRDYVLQAGHEMELPANHKSFVVQSLSPQLDFDLLKCA